MADLVQVVKRGYDRFLLLLAGLLLAASAVFAVWGLGSLRDEHQLPPVRSAGAPFDPSAAVEQLRQEASKLEAPPDALWEPTDASLFVSRIYLLRDGELVDILESDAELYPGIPNEWIIEHDLDYTDPQLGEQDADGDGFTNLEEFRAGTNPRDPASTPALWTKLRLIDSRIDKLRVKFMSLPTGSLDEVSINTISAENSQELSGSTRFYRTEEEENKIVLVERDSIGLEVETGTPLVFERAEMREVFNVATNTQEKAPVAILRNTADGKEIELKLGEVKDSPYSLATLRDTRPKGLIYSLRSGESFEIEGVSYKLIDVQEDAVTIESSETGELHTIPAQNPVVSSPGAGDQISP